MKIVLSRKGFDAGQDTGRRPSPVFPDGRILSLPIPAPPTYPVSAKQFRDVLWDGHSLAPLVQCLSDVRGEQMVHLDPDLRAEALARHAGWRPAFGQVDRAQAHLANQGVCRGDLFLFFGAFQEVEQGGRGGWRYTTNAPIVHQLFGWLQVGDILRLNTDADHARARARHPWLADHPHLNGSLRKTGKSSHNTVYVSARRLNITGTDVAGGGVFRRAQDRLMLTDLKEAAKGRRCRRSHWRLPGWFLPSDGKPLLTGTIKTSWYRCGSWACLTVAPRGQEFVFDATGIQDAAAWVGELMEFARPRA